MAPGGMAGGSGGWGGPEPAPVLDGDAIVECSGGSDGVAAEAHPAVGTSAGAMAAAPRYAASAAPSGGGGVVYARGPVSGLSDEEHASRKVKEKEGRKWGWGRGNVFSLSL